MKKILEKEGKMRKIFLPVLLAALMLTLIPRQAEAGQSMLDLLKGIDVGVSVDTTYQYIFDRDVGDGSIVERGLYPEHNDFSIDAFTVSIEKTPTMDGEIRDLVGFRADILFGEQAERLGFGFSTEDDGAVSPYQAYINLLVPTEASSFNIYAGQFTTLAGWELIEAKNNTNITRSLLFYRIPFAHSGIRATFSSGLIDFALGLSNDWDAVDDDNDGKTFESQIAINLPNDGWIGVTGYFGDTVAENNEDELRSLITVVGSMTFMEKITLVGDFEYTWDDISGDRFGVAGYATFALSDSMTVSLRGEYVDDSKRYVFEEVERESDDGPEMVIVRTGEQENVKLYEFTSTFILKLFPNTVGNTEARLEYRYDKADGVDDYFGEKDSQHGVAIQLLYWI